MPRHAPLQPSAGVAVMLA